jgi:Ribbon-helix-helix protein, copG family
MSRKPPIDEIRTARALRKLDELARTHPEAFDPARLPSSPGELAAALGERQPLATGQPRRIGRPPSADPGVPVTVKLPRSMMAQLNAEVAASDPPLSRSDAVREAIRRWLKRRR